MYNSLEGLTSRQDGTQGGSGRNGKQRQHRAQALAQWARQLVFQQGQPPPQPLPWTCQWRSQAGQSRGKAGAGWRGPQPESVSSAVGRQDGATGSPSVQRMGGPCHVMPVPGQSQGQAGHGGLGGHK